MDYNERIKEILINEKINEKIKFIYLFLFIKEKMKDKKTIESDKEASELT